MRRPETWPLAVLAALACATAMAGEPIVLDGPDTHFTRDAFARLGIPFDRAATLDMTALEPGRILVLSGREPSLTVGAAATLGDFLRRGGRVLALGGGARWMLEAKLFDAGGYYPTGTTIHQSTFDGYHPVTSGYPLGKPPEGWYVGVPMLLRATDGPLMRPGPAAISILGAGGPFSLAAFQRIGAGIALLIGADPQGGNEYLALDKPTPRRGSELGTDRLLANAIGWLRDPGGNAIPNPGFEHDADAGGDRSHWEFTLRNGGSAVWSKDGAASGDACLRLAGGRSNSVARAAPFRPLVVEPGRGYVLSASHRGTAAWAWEVAFLARPTDDPRRAAVTRSVAVAPAERWQRSEVPLEIPAGAAYVAVAARLDGTGALALDDVALVPHKEAAR